MLDVTFLEPSAPTPCSFNDRYTEYPLRHYTRICALLTPPQEPVPPPASYFLLLVAILETERTGFCVFYGC